MARRMAELSIRLWRRPLRDAWDAWNDQRDNFLSRAQSNQYLSPDIDGGEDLDAAGRWGYDPNYGNVGRPTCRRAGRPTAMVLGVEDPYGWTWVDAEPWGWAPFHYGSWYMNRDWLDVVARLAFGALLVAPGDGRVLWLRVEYRLGSAGAL